MQPEDTVHAARASNPYRGEQVLALARVERLERENAQLRRLVVALVFALCVVAGGATWSLWTLWHAAHGEGVK